MAQYDLILTQNTAAAGVEFSEKLVNVAKGGLLSADTSGVPTVLAAGTDGYMLVRDNNETTGLKWVAISAGHTQGTDAGTTGADFTIDSDSTTGKLKLVAVANAGEDHTMTVQNAVMTADVTLTLPATTGTLATQAYADGLFAANDAMLFKGATTIATIAALTTYNIGWTYRVTDAGTCWGKVVEIGDLVMAIVDRAGTGNVDADWCVAQTNLDGAVIGPASTTDNYVALFSGTTGKLLKAGSGALASGAYAAAYVHPTTNGNNHIPSDGASTQMLQFSTTGVAKWVSLSGDVTIADAGAVTIANSAVSLAKMANLTANTFIANNTGSAAAPSAITVAQAMAMLWQSAPATKTTAGTAGWIAKDSNYVYFCTATNVWARCPIATNW